MKILLGFAFHADHLYCECLVEENASLQETIQFLQEALLCSKGKQIHICERPLFEETVSGRYADPERPIGNMNIRSGMVFSVY